MPKKRPSAPEVAAEDKEFLATAFKRFKLAAEAEAENRKEALDDFRFRVGQQWADDLKKKRETKKRPCLTINRIPGFIKQITNQQREQKPATQVNALGDGADEDTAEVFQGIIRHIEVLSDAEIAYDTAFDHTVTGGWGYWRYITNYISDESFDQEILVRWVENPFSVYGDPFAQLPDRSDSNWYFVIDDMSREDYKAEYSTSVLSGSLIDFKSTGDAPSDWITKEGIRVAEYYYVEQEKLKLYMLKDGSIVPKLPEGETADKERDVIKRSVKWAKINAFEVLERRDVPGKYIPIVKLVGEEVIVDGKRMISGAVRNAKDPQRNYNYWNSAATEMIALAPKAPFVAAAGQIDQYKEMWEAANIENFAILPYDPIEIGGQALPAPARQVYEPPIQAITRMIAQADNDLKATFGIYDASLGQKGPDESGKAILARQKQTEVSVSDFSDNLARSMRFGGRILVDLIPKIYDTERIQRIVNSDGSVKQVQLSPQNPSEEETEEPEQENPEDQQEGQES